MFFSTKSLVFGLLVLKVICPEGLGAGAGQFSKSKIYTFFEKSR